MQKRDAPLRRNSADPAARTVEVTWTTGAPVDRYDWRADAFFTEVLEVTEEAVDLSRLNKGAPVLDSHRAGSATDQVAVVERAWIEKGEGLALLRFPDAGTSERADQVFEMIVQGIVRNTSVGYTSNEVREEPNNVRRSTRWTPHEISFVTVPADAAAQVRSSATPNNATRRVRLRQALLATMSAAPEPEEPEQPTRLWPMFRPR